LQRLAHPFLASLVLIVLTVGCSTTVTGAGGKKLTLVKPADQTIHRGKTNEVEVEVRRTNIVRPVVVAFSQLPEGVRVTNSKVEIPASEKTATVILHAEPDAALVTNQRVIVAARAEELEVADGFELTVKE
jgi:hypothetical protein